MMEVVTSWEALMRYARELGPARLRGNPARIREAKEHHDASAALCRKADRMLFAVLSRQYGIAKPLTDLSIVLPRYPTGWPRQFRDHH